MTMDSATEVAIESPAVDAIRRHDEAGKPGLVRLKYRRMGRDVFSFFRGSNHLFAASWATLKPGDPGPDILLCGDLHLENFGSYRTEGGEFVFDINDFDEALVGPCALDLVRCSTSILLAAQVWGLSPIRAVRTVLGYLDCYRATVLAEATAPADARPTRIDEPGPIGELVGDCLLGTQAELLDRFTRLGKSGHRTIRRSGGRLPALDAERAETVADAIREYGRWIGQPDAFGVLDVAGRIAGIGSLGVERYVALVEGDGSPDGNRLLDIKGCAPSSLLGCTDAPQPEAWTNQANRVVAAQRKLQAEVTAGLDVIAVDGETFRIRELIPEENRATLDRFRRKPSKLRHAVEVAGRVTARAQLRGARPADGTDRTKKLARWAGSPALDAMLAAAVRFAEKTREEFKAFRKSDLNEKV